ncbi:DUF262 and DUF1524 domain-containing protein [Aminobacter niigataensis]|uniref:DUF262 and DUF1524 domain-containing protein n=1 Tax=Aminobacter niigataensis TaxID=83265 RepID=UPI002284CB49|nr:DUF262 and DUF1524 domain-containing protein [Aminobacter niigataensis]CAI2936498.1 conserved protein of unknown function [Aminobacter niigataensis]
MKASEIPLLKFIHKATQFVIPIYQRNYSWTETQCRQLWHDLIRAGTNEAIASHFIGSIVYVESSLHMIGHQENFLVIDGQQRLTTSMLLIAALAKHLEDNEIESVLGAFSAKKYREYYLLNTLEAGDGQYKLLLSEADQDTFLTLIRNHPTPAEPSERVRSNYSLFRELITEHDDQLEAICRGLEKLVIVGVALDRAHDNPQLIFESMNSTGLDLSQADLIRNFILMGLKPTLQTELYKAYWRPMEKAFGAGAYTTHFDAFMRHFLTVKTGEIPNVRDVYQAFKAYSRTSNVGVAALVADIHTYALHYCAIALNAEPDVDLNEAFKDLRELKVEVSYPFLLEVYDDYKKGLLSISEVTELVRLVEAYVFRRVVCALPTNSHNKTFAGLAKTLDKDNYVESLKASFLLQPTYRGFPNDQTFEQQLKTRDLYSFRNRSYWLRRLENHRRKERVVVEDYSVEHIMPQNPDLSNQWKADLGPDWKTVHETYLHTLGNLTLSAYNSEYSDRPWLMKRDQIRDKDGNPIGLAYSPLKLNHGLGHVEVWNEEAIKNRAKRIAAESSGVWTAPLLPDEVLNKYREVPPSPTSHYSMDDHKHLAPGSTRDLFLGLRKLVLELDPNVTEEFLKVYVAYKAETNFVDVIPQARGLQLSLNIPFHEIEDPKGICVDVSGRGRWGNGDVEVRVANVEDLPYALGLIRQAHDRQMGETAVAAQ